MHGYITDVLCLTYGGEMSEGDVAGKMSRKIMSVSHYRKLNGAIITKCAWKTTQYEKRLQIRTKA